MRMSLWFWAPWGRWGRRPTACGRRRSGKSARWRSWPAPLSSRGRRRSCASWLIFYWRGTTDLLGRTYCAWSTFEALPEAGMVPVQAEAAEPQVLPPDDDPGAAGGLQPHLHRLRPHPGIRADPGPPADGGGVPAGGGWGGLAGRLPRRGGVAT